MKRILISVLLLCYSTISYGVDLEVIDLNTDTKRQVFNKLQTNDTNLNSGKAESSNVLQLDNTNVYTPTTDYHPATKVYVDSNVGEVNTITNVGSGEGVAGTKSGVDTPLKSLNAGSNVTISSTATDITISATGGGTAVQSDWSEVDNQSDSYILNKPVNSTPTTDGFMSSVDKTKLDSISAGATVSTILADETDNTKAAISVVAESVDPVKVSGVPGVVLLYEANGTETNGTGFVGPQNASSNIIMELPANEPTIGQVLSYGSGSISDIVIDETSYRQIPMSWTNSGSGGSGYVSPPTYSDSPCTVGQYSWDENYYYSCESTNQWDRFGITWTNWSNVTPSGPEITSITIPTSGDSVSIVFDETVTFGAGGNNGFVNSDSNTMTYLSGDNSNTLVYSLSSLVTSNDVLTLDYTQPGDGVEAVSDGSDVASFSGTAITNNSTLTAPTLTNAVIPSDGTTIELTFNETVTFGVGGNNGFVNSATNNMTYSSGDGSVTLIYTLASTVNSGDTLTLDYTQPGDGVESNTTNIDLISFAGTAITNNSTQGEASTLTAFIRGTENNNDSLSTGTGTISVESGVTKGNDHLDIADSAFVIDGANEWMEIQTAGNINYETGKISFYFRPSVTIENNHVLLSDASDYNLFSFQCYTGDLWRLRIGAGSQITFPSSLSPSSLSIGTVYLITLTWDINTSEASLQLDSGPIDTQTYNFTSQSPSANFRIGASNLGDTYRAEGSYDSISIYSTASGN